MKSIWIQHRTVLRFLPHLKINVSSRVLGGGSRKRRYSALKNGPIKAKIWVSFTRGGMSHGKETGQGQRWLSKWLGVYWPSHKSPRALRVTLSLLAMRAQVRAPRTTDCQSDYGFIYRTETKVSPSIFVPAYSSLETCWIMSQRTLQVHTHTLRGSLESPITLKCMSMGVKGRKNTLSVLKDWLPEDPIGKLLARLLLAWNQLTRHQGGGL